MAGVRTAKNFDVCLAGGSKNTKKNPMKARQHMKGERIGKWCCSTMQRPLGRKGSGPFSRVPASFGLGPGLKTRTTNPNHQQTWTWTLFVASPKGKLSFKTASSAMLKGGYPSVPLGNQPLFFKHVQNPLDTGIWFPFSRQIKLCEIQHACEATMQNLPTPKNGAWQCHSLNAIECHLRRLGGFSVLHKNHGFKPPNHPLRGTRPVRPDPYPSCASWPPHCCVSLFFSEDCLPRQRGKGKSSGDHCTCKIYNSTTGNKNCIKVQELHHVLSINLPPKWCVGKIMAD